MSNNKSFTRFVAVLLAVLMVLSVLVGVIGSRRAGATSINDLKQRQAQLKEKKKELQSKIQSAEYEQSSIMAKKKLLDEQIMLTEEEHQFRVSIRSKEGVSANICAERYFRGGGHEKAAGGKLLFPEDIASPEDAEAYILKVTREFFKA